jgi:hypothetical protein
MSSFGILCYFSLIVFMKDSKQRGFWNKKNTHIIVVDLRCLWLSVSSFTFAAPIKFWRGKKASEFSGYSILLRFEMTIGINFELQHTDVRRGKLEFLNKSKSIETPACMTYTLRGAVPHLLADNLSSLPIDLVQISIEHLWVCLYITRTFVLTV